jgi:CheY-like chemotaxis protein
LRKRSQRAQEVQTPAPGEYIKISIADNGIGIPKEYLSWIFDPYFTTKQKGSGLGLASSYSIIKRHGGAIVVESEMGTGTTISLFLPATREAITAPGGDAERPIYGRGKILIIDDEEIIWDTAGRSLQAAGYDVDFAEDGNEANEGYRNGSERGQPFDAVILNLTVPVGLGGKETLKRLLEMDPSVKAIVSCGYSQDPIMANYRDCGFVGVIAKPYKIRDMREAVKKAIQEEN